MRARLVIEMTPEEMTAHEQEGGTLIASVEAVELRQGVLTEEHKPLAFAVPTGASFAVNGGRPSEYRTPGPGPWIEVWLRQPQREESRGEHGDASPPGDNGRPVAG